MRSRPAVAPALLSPLLDAEPRQRWRSCCRQLRQRPWFLVSLSKAERSGFLRIQRTLATPSAPTRQRGKQRRKRNHRLQPIQKIAAATFSTAACLVTERPVLAGGLSEPATAGLRSNNRQAYYADTGAEVVGVAGRRQSPRPKLQASADPLSAARYNRQCALRRSVAAPDRTACCPELGFRANVLAQPAGRNRKIIGRSAILRRSIAGGTKNEPAPWPHETEEESNPGRHSGVGRIRIWLTRRERTGLWVASLGSTEAKQRHWHLQPNPNRVPTRAPVYDTLYVASVACRRCRQGSAIELDSGSVLPPSLAQGNKVGM